MGFANDILMRIKTLYDPKGFKQVRQDANKTQKSIKDLATSFGLVFGAREVARFISDSEQMSRAQVDARNALAVTVGGIEAYNEAMALAQRETRGMVSEVKLAQGLNVLLAQGLAKDAEEAAKLANAGAVLSRVFESQGASIELFNRLLSNGSAVLLDNFNISQAQVKQRQKEIEATSELEGTEARLQAIREIAIESAAKFDKALSESTIKAEIANAKFDDLQATIGGLLAPAFDEAKDKAAGFFDFLITRIEEAQQKTASGQGVGGISNALIKMGADVAVARTEVKEFAETIEEVSPAVEELTEAQKKHAKEVQDIRRDFARDLLDIDKDAQSDVDDAWKDFFKDEADQWKQHQKSIARIRKQAGKADARAQRNFAKSLARIDKDEQRAIKKAQQAAGKEERRESKRKQIDTLGDRRLFEFELRQLAAEGEGAAILQALERRQIEEEIAREKAQVEAEIGEEQKQDEVARIKEESQIRRQQLQEDFSESAALRQQELAEQLSDEEESFAERKDELRQYRTEKLAEIEASRVEAVAKLGEELAQMDNLTQKELRELIPIAGRIGEGVGKEFADGLSRGFARNQAVASLLGGGRGIPQLSQGPGGGQGTVPFFAEGGTVGGAFGSPQLIVAHAGETVTPAGQTAISLNTTINASGGLDEDRINALFQDFVDNTLTPALS